MKISAFPTASCEISTSSHSSMICRKAEEKLRRSAYLALRDVSCTAKGHALYLRGHLPSYYLKQVAQTVALGVEGVRHVVNLIEVVAPLGRMPVGSDFVEGSPSQSS